MYIEIEHNSDFLEHFTRDVDLSGVVVQGLDLRPHTALLCRRSMADVVFLGCDLAPDALSHVHRTGGVVFPRLPGLPYHPFRPTLYDTEELMGGYVRGDPESFSTQTFDAQIYGHFERHRQLVPLPILEALAQRLHDHAIDDALGDLLTRGDHPARVIAVMGGHAMSRKDPIFERVVQLAWHLARRGYLVTTGGGPGTMEAANLGAWLSAYPLNAISTALTLLSPAPNYTHPQWFDAAYAVRERFPKGAASLAIPTWFYGHEPSNLFSRHIAKYFSNSLREDGLLAIATYGVIYAPGSAGTVQEIFMDACQNHYGTMNVVSPMVFLGKEYWTDHLPIMPLIERLAADRQYSDFILVTDDIDHAGDFIESHPPVPYRPDPHEPEPPAESDRRTPSD